MHMKMGRSVLVFTSVVSTLGGFVFGYELGIISGALLQLQTQFHLNCVQQEAVVSSLLIGALLASVIGGILIDRHSRRNPITLSNLLIVGGSIVLVSSCSVSVLVLGRITVGFAISLSSMSCCIFVSEMVNPERRGLLVSLYEAGITVGILAAYAMNYMLSSVPEGWKYMFGFPIAPSLVQFISIWFLPSNPGMPLRETSEAQAQTGLMQLASAEETEADGNNTDCSDKRQNVLVVLFQSKDNMRMRTFIGLGLVLFQQFTGQPNVLFYASTIFHSVGFKSGASAVLASMGVGVTKVIATLVSMIYADRAGRRVLLIGGCTVMTVSLIIIGLLSNQSLHSERGRYCDTNRFQNGSSQLQDLTDGNLTPLPLVILNRTLENYEDVKVAEDDGSQHLDTSSSKGLHLNPAPHSSASSPVPDRTTDQGVMNWIILISMMAYVSAYSIGFGPMTWLVLSEIFPVWLRGRAFALASCFNWAANLIVTFSFLSLIDIVGLSWTFLLYGTIGVVAVVFIYIMLPETKGKSLQEIDKELSRSRFHNGGECCNVMKIRVSSVGYERVTAASMSVLYATVP
ncbi:solute carrier family 2, facilitated glucose transporter member 10 [Brienomyrus brachyistius]|uniref:solute carrier family 2, facilitated glucose transporter member 10 n=1 Tax=Brienomyrus brachyistius TaxID=42636 RepID=UPI0020B28A8B|nr:solute carrier family 2, facilitated glucose transporter member 10 [Brienomyrus brachyistius]XP_048878358.1 solute carrier family 2, facilitated glucose transporter member 10 [Brienomyrus brachyistius]